LGEQQRRDAARSATIRGFGGRLRVGLLAAAWGRQAPVAKAMQWLLPGKLGCEADRLELAG